MLRSSAPAAAAGVALVLLSGPAARADLETPAPEPPTPAAPADRNWSAAVRVFFGGDNNVAVVGEESTYLGPKGSPRLGFAAHATYFRLRDPQGWTAGANGALGRTIYLKGPGPDDNDGPDEYNITVFNPRLFAERPVQLGGRPGEFEASYDLRRESLAIDHLGSTHHRLVAQGRWWAMPGLAIRARLSTTAYSHGVEWSDPELNGRNGRFHRIDLAASRAVPAARARVTVTYRRSGGAADGQNFDYSGNGFKVRFDSHLRRDIWIDLSLLKDFRSYEGFFWDLAEGEDVGRKSMDILKRSGRVLWKFQEGWIADVHFKADSYHAEGPTFDASRVIGGIGVTREF